MLFAYNAKVAQDASEAGIRQHANDLLDLLDSERPVRALLVIQYCSLSHSD